jgi:glucokinase
LSCMYIWNAESSATAWLDQARCQQIMEANPDQIKVDLEQLLSLFCTTLGNVVGDLAHGRERESKQRGKE